MLINVNLDEESGNSKCDDDDEDDDNDDDDDLSLIQTILIHWHLVNTMLINVDWDEESDVVDDFYRQVSSKRHNALISLVNNTNWSKPEKIWGSFWWPSLK